MEMLPILLTASVLLVVAAFNPFAHVVILLDLLGLRV